MGGNPWGSQSPAYFFTFGQTIGGVDVACPAGTETNVIALNSVGAPTAGNWGILVTGVLTIALGATPPTAMTVNARIASGADFDNYAVSTTLLVASANLLIPLFSNQAASRTLFSSGAFVVNVSVTPTAQAVTVRNVGSRVFGNFWRTMDA